MKPSRTVGWACIARSRNTKTGDIPAIYCGQSIEDMMRACVGCPLAPWVPNRPVKCYAWGGSVKLGFGAMANGATRGRSKRSLKGTAAVKPGGCYSLEHALEHRSPKARAVRIGALADPANVRRSTYRAGVKAIRRAGLAILSYTHFWRSYRNRALKRSCMASCDNLAQADDAKRAHWVPAALVPGTDKATCRIYLLAESVTL